MPFGPRKRRSLECYECGDDVSRLGTVAPVRRDERSTHDATLVDNKGRRYWKRTTVVRVLSTGVVLEDVHLKVFEVTAQRELHSVVADNGLIEIAQYRIAEVVLLRERERVVGSLGTDSDERRIVLEKLGPRLLQAPQLQVAKGAPFAAVEGQHYRPCLKLIGQRDRTSERIGQGEVRCQVTDSQTRGDAGRVDV